MKKTFLAMLMAGSTCAVFAQNDSLNTNSGSLNSNTSYNAYGTFMATPPESVKNYVTRDYPAATTIHWQQSADLWHGYYVTNNQPMHIFYPISFHVPTASQSFSVALPVRQTWVPDEVVSKSVEMFGPTLYDISAIKGSNKQDVYMARLLENGQLTPHYIDLSGNNVTEVYRVETMDANAAMDSNMNTDANTNMNTDASNTDASKVKIKTKTSDGKESKTKMKNGKAKTKEF